MEEVTKMYPKDVRLVFKHLPLPFHNEAMPAAKASMAAGKQGKFWEFHDELFNNQGGLNADFYVKTAEKLYVFLIPIDTGQSVVAYFTY